MSKTYEFTVRLTLPWAVPVQTVKDYVREAVQVRGGSFHPDDVFFGLDDRDVDVRSAYRKSKPGKVPPCNDTQRE